LRGGKRDLCFQEYGTESTKEPSKNCDTVEDGLI
jgi:hypothetical protein